MSAYLLLVACLGLGMAFARFDAMPAATVEVLNAWILRVALPALVLVQVPRLSFEPGLLVPALAPWALMLGALAVFPWLGRRGGWDRATVGCLIVTCGLANTSFIGLPLIAALRGPQALGPAVIADQFGSFLMLATVGAGVAAWYTDRPARLSAFSGRILRFPPVWAIGVALLLNALDLDWPPAAVDVLERLAESLTPLALFSVGLQLRWGSIGEHWRPAFAGLVWKLFLAPLLGWLTTLLLGLQGLAVDVAVLQLAMAPMITGGILAQTHGLAPALASTLVGVGALLSLITVPLWSLLI